MFLKRSPLVGAVFAALVAAAPAVAQQAATETADDAELELVGEAENDWLDLAQYRILLEAYAGGDAFAPANVGSWQDGVWGARPLSPWGGFRAGLLRKLPYGFVAGGDLGLAGNREDAGNSVVGEVRTRMRLSARALGGYRLDYGALAFTPYGLIELNGGGGIRQLGVLDDTRISPLLLGGARAGAGWMVELWFFALRFDAGLGVALGGIQSFGTMSAGVAF